MGIRDLRVLLSLWLIATPVWADLNPPLGIQDEGGTETKPVFTLNCVGSSITCTQSGITGTITISGGGSGDITDVGDCATGACGQSGTLTLTGSLAVNGTSSSITSTPTGGVSAGLHFEKSGSGTELDLKNGTRVLSEEIPAGFWLGGDSSGANQTGPLTIWPSLTVSPNGAKTTSFTSQTIRNLATSSTASLNKIGLAIESIGTWNGASANNYALNIAPATGGTNNWNLYSGDPFTSMHPTLQSDWAGLLGSNSFIAKSPPTEYNTIILSQAGLNEAVSSLGVASYATDSTTGSVGGVEAYGISVAGTGKTVSTLTGFTFRTQNEGAGTVTDARALRLLSATNSGGGTITNNYGLDIQSQTVGTNNYSLYTNQASGATNYAYYGNGTGQSYFGGNVGIGDTSPAAALTVGNGDLFQVASTGAVTLNTTVPTLNFTDTTVGDNDFELYVDGDVWTLQDTTAGGDAGIIAQFASGGTSHTPSVNALRDKTAVFFCSGTMSTAMDCENTRVALPADCTLQKAQIVCLTAPAGQALIVDVNECDHSGQNCVSVWSATQGNRVQCGAGLNGGAQTSFDNPVLNTGNTVSLDVDQVGSTTAGSNVTVTLVCRQ